MLHNRNPKILVGEFHKLNCVCINIHLEWMRSQELAFKENDKSRCLRGFKLSDLTIESQYLTSQLHKYNSKLYSLQYEL